ncbi:RNA 2',3'-cyclic phosphodiesterase [Candidatus Daviesbacteria bacterium]|nr:RNA 2',3'-cyclic phosphodiesterase [Candidatus Daviesbacteria bacterium]
MRFFIGLEIPNENLLQFQAIQAKLHTLIPQVRLTDLAKIHLTLAFLGEQPVELKGQLAEIIRKAAENVPNFEVTPAYIDGFPHLHHPQALWVGVKGDIDKILLIRERIKDGLASLHLPVDERRFIPHISIAKANNHLKIDQKLEANLEKIMAQAFDPIKISSIKLFASLPQNGFHSHNTLAEIKLAG